MHRYRVRPPGITAPGGAQSADEARDSAPPQAFVPVRMPDPPSTPEPVTATNADPGEPAIVRRKWDARAYEVSGTQRTLHVEEHPPVWGPTRPDIWQRDDNKRPRAVLFETMSTSDKVTPLIDQLRELRETAPQDVGLSVVLNGAWVPTEQFTDKGGKTKAKTPKPEKTPPTPRDPDALKKFLTGRRADLVSNWNGPPLEITTAAWERRSRSEADPAGALETVQSSVPYTSLRALAASNSGALEIGDALAGTHSTLWHKMGDDDMPIEDPNVGAEREPKGEQTAEDVENERLEELSSRQPGDVLTGLEWVEKLGDDHATTVVTFGYNLTTTVFPKTTIPVPACITDALRALYRIEMGLRDTIRDLKAPIYPSEPTTYYRTIKANKADDVWREVPRTNSGGGSGQQLEGAKLVLALSSASDFKNTSSTATKNQPAQEKKTGAKPRNDSPPKKVVGTAMDNTAKGNASSSKPTVGGMDRAPKTAVGITQYAFHTVQVNTSAGGRNDGLVALLESWRKGADPQLVNEDAVEAEINKLDQCALKDGEYLDKVFQKLPKSKVLGDITGEIKREIDVARKAAATEVCSLIRAEILNAAQQPAQQLPVQQGPAQQRGAQDDRAAKKPATGRGAKGQAKK